MQQLCGTMDEEDAFVHLCDVVPKQLGDETARKRRSSFDPAFAFIEDTLARLNGSRLADVDECRARCARVDARAMG